MEYKLLEKQTADDLSAIVNEHLEKGWTLYGFTTVAVVATEINNEWRHERSIEWRYQQAMIKNK